MKTIPWLLALFSPLAFGQSLPAFYGAEGGGSISVGGRGGTVCIVDRLVDDSNSGSLRHCINTHNNTNGSRMTVVFRVAGTINLLSSLRISNPYITIAGQTAPGGGIQLSGKSGCRAVFDIQADDVVIRYLRARIGRCSGGPDVITGVGRGGRRVVLDHLSIFWSSDEGIGFWARSGTQFRDISIQNSIIAETLTVTHPKGILISAEDAEFAELMTDIDIHNSVIGNHAFRMPMVTQKSGRIINNIIYNWYYYATMLGSGIHADVIGNLYKHPDPNNKTDPDRRSEIMTWLYHPSSCAHKNYMQTPPSIYVAGNKGPWNTDPNNNWNMVTRNHCASGRIAEVLPAQYRRSSPLPPSGVPITVRHVNMLENHLLPIVGASRRLDCIGNWVSNRDSQDVRFLNWVQTNHDPNFTPVWHLYGIAHEDDVGGFPTIAGGTPCQDTDGDGMPDVWEDAMGLNKNDPSDRNQIHSSGYTMLEVYLNGPMEGQILTLAPPTNIRFSQ